MGPGIQNGKTVQATIDGRAAPVLYAGPQGSFAGLDQVNVVVPQSVAGRGTIDIGLLVDGKVANTVKVAIH